MQCTRMRETLVKSLNTAPGACHKRSKRKIDTPPPPSGLLSYCTGVHRGQAVQSGGRTLARQGPIRPEALFCHKGDIRMPVGRPLTCTKRQWYGTDLPLSSTHWAYPGDGSLSSYTTEPPPQVAGDGWRGPAAKGRLGGRVRGSTFGFVCAVHPHLNSPQNSEHLESRHTAQKNTVPRREGPAKRPAPSAPHSPTSAPKHTSPSPRALPHPSLSICEWVTDAPPPSPTQTLDLVHC